MKGSRVSDNPNINIVVGALLDRYSKGKDCYYAYSYGYLHAVGMLVGMTITIINGACGIGVNTGHRTTS